MRFRFSARICSTVMMIRGHPKAFVDRYSTSIGRFQTQVVDRLPPHHPLRADCCEVASERPWHTREELFMVSKHEDMPSLFIFCLLNKAVCIDHIYESALIRVPLTRHRFQSGPQWNWYWHCTWLRPGNWTRHHIFIKKIILNDVRSKI